MRGFVPQEQENFTAEEIAILENNGTIQEGTQPSDNSASSDATAILPSADPYRRSLA